MRWQKKGLIFSAEGQHAWMAHHATAPIADKLNDETLRIYFSSRDMEGHSHVAFIEVALEDPRNVLYVHDRPILSLGKLGAFDDSGVVASCLVKHEEKKYLYYVGYNRTVTVPYRNALGLAVSSDGGLTFRRMFDGPVLDRSPGDPFFIATSFAMIDEDCWKLWYASSTGWTIVSGQPEPQYQIKYAESKDGINWERENVICIQYKSEGEANVRPFVLKGSDLYRMWYCYRGSINFRSDKSQSYRIGYAESHDGIRWSRRDEEVGIDRSPEGWDSDMIFCPCLYEHKGRKYMLYNGNGFGETGFGYAVLEEPS